MMRNSARQFLYLYRNRGSILIVSMWVLVCFSILSVGLAGLVSSRLKMARAIEQRIIGQYLAKAACVAFKIKRQNNRSSYDTISELSEKQEQVLGNGKFAYTLKDEEAKININTSSIDTISRLPGLDSETAKDIFESELKPFKAKEEILLVDGVSEDIFDQCGELVTVYTSGNVNINTAGADVLKVLGLDDDLIALIITFRLGPDRKEGTPDDGVFENASEVINELRSASPLFEAQEAKLLQLLSLSVLSVASHTFSLQIETTVFEKAAMRYNIVMDKEKIKRWTEF